MALAGLLLSITTASAATLDGRYRAQCSETLAWEDTDGRLEITGNELRFWEFTCTLSNPIRIDGLKNGAIYDALCSGEGDEWKDRIVMRPSEYLGVQSVSLISNQGGHTYRTCPDQR